MTEPHAVHEAAAKNQQALDRSLLRGLAWTGSAKWLSQLVSWASFIVIARILVPSDLGVIGLAAMSLGLANLASTFGLGAAVIQRRNLEDRRIAEIAGVSVAVSTLLFALSVAAASPLAAFFYEPRLRDVTIVLGSLFVVGGVAVVPRALLSREFRFRELALIDTAEAMVQAATAVVLALLGAGYWALVWSQVIAKLLALVALLLVRRHEIRWPAAWRDIGSELGFGWRFVVSQVAWYCYSNADFLVVGRLLGTHAMGIYSLGWQLATLPVERVSALLSSVTPPVFSAVKDDGAALRRYFGGMTRALAYVTLPMAVGLLLVADQFVLVLLGEKWVEVILPLQVLAAFTAYRSLATLHPLVLMYCGRERQAARYNVLLAIIMPVLFALGSIWGVTGVALGWLAGYPLVAVALFLRTTLRVTGMSGREYVGLLARPALGALWMAAVVGGLRLVTPAAVPQAAAFAMSVVAGILSYGLFVHTFCRDDVRALLRVVRGRPADEPST